MIAVTGCVGFWFNYVLKQMEIEFSEKRHCGGFKQCDKLTASDHHVTQDQNKVTRC